MPRYHVYALLCSEILFIDTVEKKMTVYNSNLFGQLYNLKTGGKEANISKRRIAGLIRRMKNRNVGPSNSYVIDPFIFKYLLTDEQRKECGWTLHISSCNTFVCESDDYAEAITKACEWVYMKCYTGSEGERLAEHSKYTKYYKDYLAKKALSDT